jgi:hypothetical protein
MRSSGPASASWASEAASMVKVAASGPTISWRDEPKIA